MPHPSIPIRLNSDKYFLFFEPSILQPKHRPISRILQRVPPLHFEQNRPFWVSVAECRGSWVVVVGKNKIILAKFMKKISIVWKHNILTTIKSRLIVYNNKQTKRKIANKRVGQKEKELYWLSFANVFSLTDLSKIVRDRSLITSPGGAVVLEEVTILKQAPFWGVNFSLVRNMRGVKFYDTATAV